MYYTSSRNFFNPFLKHPYLNYPYKMGEESDHVRDLRTSTINKMFDTFLPFTPENSPDRGKLTPIGNEIKLKDFTDEVEKTGLKMNDYRLSKMKKWMDTWNANNVRNGTPTTMITRKQFHELVTVEISVFELIKKALTGQFIIPNMDDFTGKLEAIFREVAKITDGHNASYIPQLDKVDRNGWGISVTTVDGQRFNIGDTKVPFTVQSTSKAISYAIALTEYGEERVHEHIGQEPSGRLFNDISLDRQGRPWNPMINAGAIMYQG